MWTEAHELVGSLESSARFGAVVTIDHAVEHEVVILPPRSPRSSFSIVFHWGACPVASICHFSTELEEILLLMGLDAGKPPATMMAYVRDCGTL